MMAAPTQSLTTVLHRLGKSAPPMTAVTPRGGAWDLRQAFGHRIDAATLAEALAKLCRFNGATGEFYSVAQHSVLVCDRVSIPARGYALLHDAHEMVVGDLTLPVKDYMRAAVPGFDQAWRKLTARIDAQIFTAFGLEQSMPAAVDREIALADLQALATEQRDVLLPNAKWQAGWGDPWPKAIQPWPWPRAAEMFEKRCRVWLPKAEEVWS